jgi:hypothetical protein
MPECESLEYLESELSEQIKGFDDSRQYFRRQQKKFTIATAVLSSCTTVLIGVEKMLDKLWWLSIFALISSASITVVAAIDQYYRSREMWVQKTDAWMALQNLDAHIKYEKAKSGHPLEQTRVDEFYTRFDKILMGEHDTWKAVRSSHRSQGS